MTRLSIAYYAIENLHVHVLYSIIFPDKFYRDCRKQGGTTKRSLNRELLDEFLGYLEEEELHVYCLACVLLLTEPKEGASYAKKLISEAYDDQKHGLKNACKASVPSRLGMQNAVFADTMQNADRRIDVVFYQFRSSEYGIVVT